MFFYLGYCGMLWDSLGFLRVFWRVVKCLHMAWNGVCKRRRFRQLYLVEISAFLPGERPAVGLRDRERSYYRFKPVSASSSHWNVRLLTTRGWLRARSRNPARCHYRPGWVSATRTEGNVRISPTDWPGAELHNPTRCQYRFKPVSATAPGTALSGLTAWGMTSDPVAETLRITSSLRACN